MKSIEPNQDNLQDIFSKIPSGIPIVMVNLLKFREDADYGDASISCTGREAYQTYSKTALRKVREVGGEPIWLGNVSGCLIAPDGEEWDQVLLVRYPSINAFKKMLKMPDYQESTVHRTAALIDSRLIATVEESHV
jgi:uncharacterized protein (DUF1330 family)